MPLTEGQVQVRDLVMGPDTLYKVVEFNPWARTTRADQSGPRAWADGSWSGAEFGDEVAVPIRVVIRASDAATWMDAHHDLAAAFRPIGDFTTDIEMRWVTGGREYVMFGRPRMVDPEPKMIGTGQVWTKLAFTALDPTIYAGVETAPAAIGLPTFSGGLTVPFTVPFTVDGVMSGGFVDLTNEGTKPAGLNIRIDGPVPDPWIVLELDDGTSQILRIDVDLTTGQWVDIDTADRTVLLNGTGSLRGQASGDFPLLPKGTHRLVFRAADYNDTALLTPRFRSAWYG